MIHIALAAGLLFAPASGATAPPSSGRNLFVGHYGETFEFDRLWEVEASMQGPIEVIRLRPKGAQLPPGAYKPENFSEMQLIQLLVIPKDAPGGASTLVELRDARAAEAIKAGVPSEIKDAGSLWPPGSFTVWIEKPYRLFQLYTETDTEFMILSAGVGEEGAFPRPVIDLERQRVLDSLGLSLRRTDGRRGAALPAPSFLAFFAQPFWTPWRWINGICLLLAGLASLTPKLGRVRLIALGTLLVSNVWTFAAAGLALAAVMCAPAAAPHGAAIAAIPALALPWLGKAAAKRLGDRTPDRFLRWGAALSAFSFAVMAVIETGQVATRAGAFEAAACGYLFGILFGAAYGALLERRQDAR